MADKEKIIHSLNALSDSMHKNQCYACSYEFIETAKEFGTCILADAIEYIESQPEIIRCKNCKYHGTPDCSITCETPKETPDDWYCADGEQKGDDDDEDY